MDEPEKPKALDYAGPQSNRISIDDTPSGQLSIDSLCTFGLFPPLLGYVLRGLFFVLRGAMNPRMVPGILLVVLVVIFFCSIVNLFTTGLMTLAAGRMRRWWHAFALVAGSTWLLLTCCVTGSLFMR